MSWNNQHPLRLGQTVNGHSEVTSIEKKRFDKNLPLIFLNQTIKFRPVGQEAPSVIEERMHVYLPREPKPDSRVRTVLDLPTSHEFTLTYKPSLTTLFRFSALMFNAHRIHLDKDYAQMVDGYPERLVHGPLTALMLLETVAIKYPEAKIAHFEYRAENPTVVGVEQTIHGKWLNDRSMRLWCSDPSGVVGMTGKVEIANM